MLGPAFLAAFLGGRVILYLSDSVGIALSGDHLIVINALLFGILVAGMIIGDRRFGVLDQIGRTVSKWLGEETLYRGRRSGAGKES